MPDQRPEGEPDPSVAPADGATRTAFASVEVPGGLIGPYHLLQIIGQGGMGDVWLAEQRYPVRRRVALKLIKAGMNTREVVARFESERQALALMDHPAIARVYDAGYTSQGAPYFVMEYVAGVPITEYCDTHKLTTAQRLDLFIHVCQGVQHAHQKAIIHRDLKPSNILVSEVDGEPVPKIIDFGVAKALSQKLTQDTMFTRIGALIGTPEYMSPEQAGTGGADIDTRTDVYSLGVILYELLVGSRPLDLSQSTYEEMLRNLRERDSPKPSTRLRSTLGDSLSTIARNRHTEISQLAKQLRGDLDCITLKCLEKDRGRRYGSPSDLAADINRYLHNEPVTATPASTAYRLRKYAAKYRGAFLTVAALVVALVLGAAISLWQAVRARHAEQVAATEASKAKAIDEFLERDLLDQSSSDASNDEGGPDPNVKVRVLLDRAANHIGPRFKGKPQVEAAIRLTIASSYLSLGLLPEALKQAQASYDLDQRALGPGHPDTLDALQTVATIESDQGRILDCLRSSRQALAETQKHFAPDDPRTAVALQSVGVPLLLLGRYAESQPLLQRALAILDRKLGYDNIKTLDTSDSLAALYLFDGRQDKAEALLEKGLLSYRRMYGPEHPFTQREMFGLGRVYFGQGKYTQAEGVVTQVLAHLMKAKGPDHLNTLQAQSFLSKIYIQEGRMAEGIALASSVRDASIRKLGPLSRDALIDASGLAAAYEANHDFAAAEPLRRTALAGYEKTMGEKSVNTLRASTNLARCWIVQKRYTDAETMLKRSLPVWEQSAHDNWQRYETESLIGASLLGENQPAAAKPYLQSGYNGMKSHQDQITASERKYLEAAARRFQTNEVGLSADPTK